MEIIMFKSSVKYQKYARWQFSAGYESHPCHFLETISDKAASKIKMKPINQLAIFGDFIVKRRYFGDSRRK